jgi:hypothetical protein
MPPQLERGLAGRDRGFIWAGAWWCGLMTEQPPEPNGLVYQPDFFTQAEEQEVLDVLKAMEFHPITMHGQTARRTVRHFSLATAMRPGSWSRPTHCRTTSVPGAFGALGNDYRGDMVRFVQDAFRLPPPPSSSSAASTRPHGPWNWNAPTGSRLRTPTPPHPAPHRTSDGRSRAGVPLHTRRTRSARWASGGRHISPTPHPGQS